MAVDMRARYFGEFDEGAMPSFGVLPQATPQPSAFEVAPIMDTPRQAAVMPMTTEAVAPNYLGGLGLSDADLASLYALSSSGNFNQGNYGSDFGSLDNVYGMNFGSDLGSGGSGGSLFKVNPYLQTLQAPLSDKGNPTAYGGGGIEVKSPTQTFRLLDKNTGQVVYEGVGYEGAQEAIDRASALTAKEGAKAQWQIQTPNSQQASGYSTVANEKRSQSTLGDIASVALPVGMALLTGGLSLPAQMAAAGIAGAAGAGLAGKDPAKAGLISAATAGLMGGTGANAAIGRAVGSIGGPLAAKATEEVAKTAAEKAAEQIVVTALSKAAQGAGSAIGNTLLSQGIKGGLSEITGYKTPAQKFAEQPVPETVQPPLDDAIVVSGSRLRPAVPNYGGALAGVVSPIATEFLPKSVLPEPLPSEPAPTDDTIVVTGNLPTKTPSVIAGIETALPAITQGALTAAQTGGAPDDKLTAKDAANYLRLASLAAGLIGGGGGGGGGGGVAGSQAINPIFSAKLPTPGVGGAFKVGGLDYTTPPARSAADMYRYAMGPAMDIRAGTDLSKATSPYAGYGPGTLGEETFKRVTGMAHGGSMGYARGSSRDSFAVEGPGTGRSDDIPAVLSDGEYVIDAETVALLGDGSSKAGAKKLDEMRVKVRKHKGRNLAKGKFSVNAKRPEKYLSGGRT